MGHNAKFTNAIRKWMYANVHHYVDECNEVNATKLVEAWDIDVAGGGETLDPDHIAWTIGAEVAMVYGEKCRKASGVRHER